MFFHIERFGSDDVFHLMHRFFAEHDRSEHRALRRNALRRNADIIISNATLISARHKSYSNSKMIFIKATK